MHFLFGFESSDFKSKPQQGEPSISNFISCQCTRKRSQTLGSGGLRSDMKSVQATQKTILHQSLETDLDYGSYICRVKVCYAGFRSIGLSSSASTIWICRIQISRILNWSNSEKHFRPNHFPRAKRT